MGRSPCLPCSPTSGLVDHQQGRHGDLPMGANLSTLTSQRRCTGKRILWYCMGISLSNQYLTGGPTCRYSHMILMPLPQGKGKGKGKGKGNPHPHFWATRF